MKMAFFKEQQLCLLKNAGIKNQTNLKHCELGIKGKLDLIQKRVTAE